MCRWPAGRGRCGAARPGREYEGCQGGPGDGGEDVVSQVGVAARMRRLQQRHPVPAIPRRDRHSGFQQRMGGDLRRGQRAVRCGRRRVRRRQRHRVGARLPAAVGAVRSAEASARCADRPFNHVPCPGYEIFAQLPWRRQRMLGADLIGFQRPADATNFLRACRRVAPNSRGPVVHALSAPNADSTGDGRAPGGRRDVRVGGVSDLDRLHPVRFAKLNWPDKRRFMA